nr:alpha/beta hydrolase [Tessaracoccus coleopterorum]
MYDTVIGSGPRQVVFLHGLFGQGKNFSSVATALGDVATCHLVDLPNHGRSPWTEEFDLDGQADAVADWITETFDGPVALIGHSLGGKIGMRLALRRPELIDRLMVVDISPPGTRRRSRSTPSSRRCATLTSTGSRAGPRPTVT